MSLTTFSTFYYDYEFDENYMSINFDEGGSELTGTVELGSFTPTEMAVQIQTAMNDVGGQAYTVTFNRSDRTFTISATSNFTLRVSTGSSGNKAFSKFGFTGSNRTGANTYTGSPAGSEYLPQFILQDHIPTTNNQRLVSPAINKAASGKVEVIRFGVEKFMQCNIKYITNKISDGKIIRNNPTGVSDAQSFMQYLMTKKPVEFMPNELSRNTFETFILESTPDYQNGAGYKLKELYDIGLPEFFETGALVFRLIED